MSEAPATLEQAAAAQADEYGQYRATTVITVNGARAFNPGDPVPASHVSRGVVESDQVERITIPGKKG